MLEIKQISTSRRDLLKFVHFGIDLYKGNDYYVPPFVLDDVGSLNPKTNPAFEFCEAAYFMAYRDGRPVGRIAAIINSQTNKKYGSKDCRFGFLDFTDDPEVSGALFGAAEKWARSKGMDRMIGPLGFTDMDREGLLVEGFEELSTMATNYNYPYYERHVLENGYVKDSDWVEYLLTVPEKVPERFDRIATMVKEKYRLTVVKYKSRKKAKAEIGRPLFDLINEAYKNLYQYSPLTERQKDYYVDYYLGLVTLDLLTFVKDSEGKLVGVGITLPSLSRALQKSGGRLLPFGWLPLLKGLKGKNDRVDLLLVAVDPEYQNKGVNALMFQDLIPMFNKHGFKYAESNPEMELNSKVQSQWELFEPRQHRRRRSYAKSI